MFLLTLCLALAAPPKPLTVQEKAFLMRIDKAVSRMSDKKAAFVRFEKEVSKSDAIRCKRLLPKLALNDDHYTECAFVQAYYGIDYEQNLQRLMRPYRLLNSNYDQWSKEYPNATDGEQLTDFNGIIHAFNWLYLKHHDLLSLGAWEDLRLDGHPAEANSEELSDLFRRHATDMLKAASGHPQRIEYLAMMIRSAYSAEDTIHPLKPLLRHLNAYLHSKDKRVASAAQSLTRELKSRNYGE